MGGKTLKLKPSTWERAEALVPHLHLNEDLRHALGGVVEPADVLRIAVERGLAAIEHDAGAADAARPQGHLRSTA